jgi:hypothetical protein
MLLTYGAIDATIEALQRAGHQPRGVDAHRRVFGDPAPDLAIVIMDCAGERTLPTGAEQENAEDLEITRR